MYEVSVEEACCFNDDWVSIKSVDEGDDDRKVGGGTIQEEGGDSVREMDGDDLDDDWDESYGDSEEWKEEDDDCSGGDKFQQHAGQTEESRNGPLESGESSNNLGDGEGGGTQTKGPIDSVDVGAAELSKVADVADVGGVQYTIHIMGGKSNRVDVNKSNNGPNVNISGGINLISEMGPNDNIRGQSNQKKKATIGLDQHISGVRSINVESKCNGNINVVGEVEVKSNANETKENKVSCHMDTSQNHKSRVNKKASICDKTYKSKSLPNLTSRDEGMFDKDGNKKGSLAMKFGSKSYDGAMDSGRLWIGKLSMRKFKELASTKHPRVKKKTISIQKRSKEKDTSQGGSRSSCAKSIRVNRKIGQEELSQLEEFGESIGLIWEGRHKAAGNDVAIREPGEERAQFWVDGWGVNDMVGFVNVYGPRNESDRQTLWCRISAVIGNVNACWCIFGDFNEVRRLDERMNTDFSTRGALEFNDFIRRANLTDVPLGGKRYTRISDDGKKISKLDRFLVSEEFQRVWRSIGSVALDRKLSDHCPIVLLDKGIDFRPNSFRFFDAWMEEMDFQELSKEKYMGLDAEIETARKEADLWEKEAESRTLVDYELAMWQKARADWIEKDGIKAKMLKQKARIQWYEEGDENSKYFHAKVRKRYRKNGFRGLMVDGMWCENPATIKQTVYEYFKGVYEESGTDRPKFISNRFKRLSEAEANLLEAEFEDKEVWEAVKECGSSKASGPDGFNFKFLKKSEGLNIMMQEVLNRGLFEVSGLKVNLSKSKLYGIGIEMEEIEDYARSLECRAGKLPFLYLGLPIGNNMWRIEN
ncbi:putative RNA-directed DNA polymerase, eukaryota [Tanacetum coccineum]